MLLLRWGHVCRLGWFHLLVRVGLSRGLLLVVRGLLLLVYRWLRLLNYRDWLRADS